MISKTKTLLCILSIAFLFFNVYANPPLRGDFVQQGELFIDDAQFEKGFFQLLLGREALEVTQDVVFATEVKQNLALLASLPQPHLTIASTTPSSFFLKGQANGTILSVTIYDTTGTPIATNTNIPLADDGTFETELPYDGIIPLKLYYAQLSSQNGLLHSPPLFVPIINNHFSRKLFNNFPDSLLFHEFSFMLPQEFTAYTIRIEQDGALIEEFTTQSGYIQRPLADGTYSVTLTALQETTEVLSKTFTFTVQSTLPQATLNNRPLLIPSQEIINQNIMLHGVTPASYSINENPLPCNGEEICDHTLSSTDTDTALTITNDQGQYTTTLVAAPSLPTPQLTSINPWLQATSTESFSSSRKHVLLPYTHFPRNGIVSTIPRQYILPHLLQPGINKIPLLNQETVVHTYITYVPEELHIQTTYTKDAVIPGKEETFTLSDADATTLLQVYHNGATIAEVTGPTVTFQLTPKQGFNALVITLDGTTVFNDIYFYETASPEVLLYTPSLLRNQDLTFLVNHTHNLRNFTLVIDDTSYTDVIRKGNFIQFDHSFTPGTYSYTLNALHAPTQETIELSSGSFSVQNLSLLRITDAKNTPLITYGNTLVQAADTMRISFDQDVIFQKLLVNTIPVTNYGLGNNILTLNLSKYPILTSLEFVAVDNDGNSYTGTLTMNNHTPQVVLYGIFSWNDDHSVLVGAFPNDFIFWDTLTLSSNAQTYVADSYFYSFFNASSLAFLKGSTIFNETFTQRLFFSSPQISSSSSSSSEHFSLEVYDHGAQLTVDYAPDSVIFTDNTNQRKLAPPCGEQCFSLKHGSYSMNTPTTLNGIYAHPSQLSSNEIGIIQSCLEPLTTTLLTQTPLIVSSPCQQQERKSTPLLYTKIVCPKNSNAFNITFTNGTLHTIPLLTANDCASQQRNLSLNITNAFNAGKFFLTDAETIIVQGLAQEGDIIHVHIGDFLVHAHSSALDGPFSLPISLRSFLQQKSEQKVTLHVTAINKNTYSQETVDIIYTDDLNGYLKILIE